MKREPCSARNFSVMARFYPTLSARFETTVLSSSNFVVINVRIAHFYSNFSTLRAGIIHMQTEHSIPHCVRF